jgi:hypothetical protein
MMKPVTMNPPKQAATLPDSQSDHSETESDSPEMETDSESEQGSFSSSDEALHHAPPRPYLTRRSRPNRHSKKSHRDPPHPLSSLESYHTEPFPIPEGSAIHIPNQVFFKVEVIDVSSPSRFLFKANFDMLQPLLNDMDLHYKASAEDLMIRGLKQGLPVAVFDEDKWQRAEVLCVSGPDVFLFFVDSGAKKYVKMNSLRYLAKEFTANPRACHKGSLFGVKPKDGASIWSAEATNDFRMKSKEQAMFATVKELEDGVHQLSLVTNLVSQIRMNDYLVKKGFADPDENVDGSKNLILVS